MIKETASKIKNSFGKYLDLALIEGEVYICRHSRVIAKIVPVEDDKFEELGES